MIEPWQRPHATSRLPQMRADERAGLRACRGCNAGLRTGLRGHPGRGRGFSQYCLGWHCCAECRLLHGFQDAQDACTITGKQRATWGGAISKSSPWSRGRMRALRCVSDKAGSCVFRSMLLHMLAGSGKSIRGLAPSKYSNVPRQRAVSPAAAVQHPQCCVGIQMLTGFRR